MNTKIPVLISKVLFITAIAGNSIQAASLSPADAGGLRNTSGTTIIELDFSRAYGDLDRGIEHYDISAISGTLRSATLDIEVYSLDPNGRLDIYQFAGDGDISIDEWAEGLMVFSETSIPESTYLPLSFDITALLQTYVDASANYLSFNYRGPGSRVNFGTNNGIGTADSVINYEVVPVPAAVWLFGSGLLGLIGIARRKQA